MINYLVSVLIYFLKINNEYRRHNKNKIKPIPYLIVRSSMVLNISAATLKTSAKNS